MQNQSPQKPNILVIGLGNAYRSDDAAGLMAVRRVKQRAPEFCSAVEHSGEGAALMELWKDADAVMVIDAVQSGAAPGTVSRFDASLRPLPASTFRSSTHAFSLLQAIELSRALQQLPCPMIVYGIEAQNFAAGTSLSPAVELGMQTVVEKVLQELSHNTLYSPT